MDILDLFDPHSIFYKQLKESHNRNVTDFFDNLIEKSNVDIVANKETMKELDNFDNLRAAALKKEKNMIALKVFLIVLIVIIFIASIILIGYASYNDSFNPIFHIIGLLGIAFAIGLIILICKKITPEIKKRKARRVELEEKVATLKEKGYQQLYELNRLFDWNMSSELVHKTVPLIEMDKYFDIKKYQYLNKKYGFNVSQDNHKSVVFVQSGAIEGNPFLIERVKIQEMINVTYTGSLTISWSDTVIRDGKVQRVTRTQTLHASVEKPKPVYRYETMLIYGNDAAPNLSFSRSPSSASGKSDKQIDRIVDSGERKLDDLVEETLTDDKPGAYTKLGNVEFDVLFGAQDRDNETEFRLLFTPLSQQSLLKLIKEKNPYGDDFSFMKKKCLNYIISEHANLFDITGNPSIFEGYNLEKMKEFFIKYNNEYFQSLFFDLAPILSIPLYHQQKPVEYIYEREFASNVAPIEHQVMANSFSQNLLRPDGSETELILKTELIKKNKNSDNVRICSHAFICEQRLTYVSVLGGDGRFHNVPVRWKEYIPVKKDFVMEISQYQLTKKEYEEKKNNQNYQSFLATYVKDNTSSYQRGLLSLLLKDDKTTIEIDKLNSIMKIEEEKICQTN